MLWLRTYSLHHTTPAEKRLEEYLSPGFKKQPKQHGKAQSEKFTNNQLSTEAQEQTI